MRNARTITPSYFARTVRPISEPATSHTSYWQLTVRRKPSNINIIGKLPHHSPLHGPLMSYTSTEWTEWNCKQFFPHFPRRGICNSHAKFIINNWLLIGSAVPIFTLSFTRFELLFRIKKTKTLLFILFHERLYRVSIKKTRWTIFFYQFILHHLFKNPTAFWFEAV